MKRKAVSEILLILLIISTLPLTLNVQPVKAEDPFTTAIIYVPDDYPKIQWAVGNASEGDMIIVRDGIYYENIIVDVPHITVRSENGPEVTIINSPQADRNAIIIAADNVTIEGFTITGSSQTYYSGIHVVSNGNKIISNHICHNSYGLNIDSSSNNTVVSNSFFNNSDAIHLSDSTGNTISRNKIFSNDYGIDLDFSDYNLITSNNISENNFGVYGGSSNYNTIISNNISNNKYRGIHFQHHPARPSPGSWYNVITQNEILNNDIGISFDSYSGSNRIYLNNIASKTYNVRSYSKNSWNSAEPINYVYNNEAFINYLGNYWSDYVGSDVNGDGIGDTPYSINSNKDNYPLIEPFENYIISLKLPVHNLNTGEDFLTIQSAIDDPDTQNGHIIAVDPGVYQENVIVTKSLTIKSTSGDPTNTIIEAKNPEESIFSIQMVNFVNISGFTIRGSDLAGIELVFACNCSIFNNIISNNSLGIYVGGIAVDSYLVGGSENNKIYHNNFIHNDQQVFIIPNYTNVWDDGYPSGGNYWSDYTGDDEYSGPNQDQPGSDGIGDTPYIIDDNNVDRYPLMEPWGFAPKPEEWSFAIITDLHIGRGYPDYGGEGWDDKGTEGQDYYLTERLERVVEEIKALRSRHNIKFVAVLGDISDSGEYSELEKAKEILDGLNYDADGDGKLDMVYVPVIGNHDVWPYTEDSEAGDPLPNFFHEVFQEQFDILKSYFGEQNWAKQPGLVHQNYAFKYRNIKFICLDFVSREHFQLFFPLGKGAKAGAELHGETIQWLNNSLREDESTVLFSHHPMIDPEASGLFPDIWEYISMEISCFDDDDLKVIEGIIIEAKANILANFAGHIHGYYSPYEPWLPPKNPHYMDANVNYTSMGYTPNGIEVIATEALMVGSNEPTPKSAIRIVKIRGDVISNANIFEGEVDVRAVNPYLRIKPREIDWWDYIPYLGEFWNELKAGKVPVDFEAYAFSKRASTDYPIHYNLEFGDGSSTSVWISDWDKRWQLPKPHFYDGTPGKTYDVTLTVTGFTPEGEEIHETLKQKVVPSQWIAVGVSSPVDITLTDPDGFVISKGLNEIPGAAYIEFDFNGDGHLEDLIVIPDRKTGDYFVSVSPEPGASFQDTYTLWISSTGLSFTLAKDVQIDDIPSQPYIISSTENEIMIWNYLFEDVKRGTKLYINTNNKVFRFTALDGHDSGVIEAPKMRIIKINSSKPSIEIILICYRAENISFYAVAINSDIDFCFGHLYNKQTKQTYFLIDRPGIE